jgi:hypothetical protein
MAQTRKKNRFKKVKLYNAKMIISPNRTTQVPKKIIKGKTVLNKRSHSDYKKKAPYKICEQ